jgi:hypothetical protein
MKFLVAMNFEVSHKFPSNFKLVKPKKLKKIVRNFTKLSIFPLIDFKTAPKLSLISLGINFLNGS